VDPGRDPVRLGRYLEAYALNTAGIASDATLFEFAGVNRRTAVAYERLLTSLFVVDALGAWSSNRLKRLSRIRKRHLVDPALIASILQLDVGAVLRDGDLLGRVLESFVVAQVRAELAVCASRPRLYHLREEHGRHEVDLLAELGAERLVAFEVKAGVADLRAARHLTWLRERLGERFTCGVVFHTGPRPFELGDRILALPICALWG
jgi:predicted AAA+ superfamily ATPase